MLRLRFLSAVVGVPVLLALAVLGGWPYVLVVACAAAIGMVEITSMLGGAGFRPLTPLAIALAVLSVLDALVSEVRTTTGLLLLAVLGTLIWVMRRKDTNRALVDWALTITPA